MRRVRGLIVLCGLVAAAACGGGESTMPRATTDAGVTEGVVLASGVKAWLGVPFAKAPVRELRWREAQPHAWAGVYHADRKMPQCIQVLRPHDINHYFGEEATSEDCLYMNIWAPATATPTSKLPVVVFIYGGGGTVGSSGMANYDGAVFAGQGAIFVNFNYRVGILGFMAHPELTKEQGGHSGNYGYMDQRFALQWIQRNIAAFGGDPTKVLITGQSAGARSVAQQIFSPQSKGLFRAAAMFSACNYTVSNTPLAEGEATGLEIQKALEASDLEALRNVPADRILAIQNETQLGRSVQGVRTSGVIDGYFMPGSGPSILEAKGAADVPIIASFTHDEANNQLKGLKTADEYRAKVKTLLKDQADAFLAQYPVASDADVALMAQTVANEGAGLANSRTCAVLQAKHHQSPTYVTVFSRKHPYVPGVRIADQDTATIGAYHTSEVPYYYGTQDAYNLFRPTRNWTDYDRDLSKKLMASLIAFANTGNPSTAEVAWPAWAADKEQYIEFGDAIRTLTINAARMAFLEPLRAALAPLPANGPRRFPRD